MALDIKEKIEEIVEKVAKDPALKAQFQKDPVAAVEKILGVDLPDEALEKIAAGVKGKLTLDSVGGVAEKLKKLF